MSLFGLTSIVPGVAALAGQAAERLADGLSFAEELLRSEETENEQTVPVVDPLQVEAKSEFEAQLNHFRETLQDRLSAAGVNLGQAITLKSDGFGGIEVDGEHPDRALIERLLRDDAELTAAFQQLSTEYAGVSVAETRSRGEEADSAQRVLDDIRRRDFRVTFHGDQASVAD